MGSLREEGVDLSFMIQIHIRFQLVSLREEGVDLSSMARAAQQTQQVSLREEGVDLSNFGIGFVREIDQSPSARREWI